MREQFEVEIIEEAYISGQPSPDLSLSPCVLDNGEVIYRNEMVQACWWAFRKGWKAALKELLPC